MSQYDPMFDLKISVGYSIFHGLVILCYTYLEDYLMYEHHTLGLWISMTQRLT